MASPDPDDTPARDPLTALRENRPAMIGLGLVAIVAVCAGPVAYLLQTSEPEPVAAPPAAVVAEVPAPETPVPAPKEPAGAFRVDGVEVGAIDANGRRSLAFEERGVRKALTMTRPRGQGGAIVLDDAYYLAQEQHSPAYGWWIAKDGDRYRLISVQGYDGKPGAIGIGPPQTEARLLADIRLGLPDFKADPAVFR